MYIYIYIHICTCTYIYIYIYTHIHKLPLDRPAQPLVPLALRQGPISYHTRLCYVIECYIIVYYNRLHYVIVHLYDSYCIL